MTSTSMSPPEIIITIENRNRSYENKCRGSNYKSDNILAKQRK